MLLTLTATPLGGGTPIVVNGECHDELGNGHLIWALGLAVITFPIGSGFVVWGFNSMEAGFVAEVVAMGMDDAAKKLAAELAAQPAIAGTHFRVVAGWQASIGDAVADDVVR